MMSAIEKALTDAVAAGYLWNKTGQIYCSARDGMFLCQGNADMNAHMVPQERIFLDPAFWQALGKARGWANTKLWESATDGKPGKPLPIWKLEWHRFIDALANGESAEDFFTAL